MKHFVVFDRDGTLIEHVPYLIDPKLISYKFHLKEALLLLSKNNISFGIISNQSLIGRKIGNIENVESINNEIRRFISDCNLDFDFIYICPHLPDEGCNCRKPKTELGTRVIKKYKTNASNGFVVGDQDSDLIFGKNLGFRTIHISKYQQFPQLADYTTDDLLAAVKWIVQQVKG